MNKRGQGLPITTIIIAILALIVLVVIILIFTGKIKVFGGELVSCEGKGGFCSKNACARGAQTTISDTNCPKGEENCCLSILPASENQPCKKNEHCKAGLTCSSNVCAKT